MEQGYTGPAARKVQQGGKLDQIMLAIPRCLHRGGVFRLSNPPSRTLHYLGKGNLHSDTQKDPAWYTSWRKSSNSLILTNIARIASEQHKNWNIWDLRKKMILT